MNRRLLAALAEDPRLSASELARRVGMSAPAVRERVARLEEAGVIRGYRLDIDPAAIGLPVAAWVRIRPGPGQLPKIAELAAADPRGQRVPPHLRRGLLPAQGPRAAIEALESVLDQFLLHGQTTSSFIVSTPVAPRPPAPS